MFRLASTHLKAVGIRPAGTSTQPPTRKVYERRQCDEPRNPSRPKRRSRRLACVLLIMTAENMFFDFVNVRWRRRVRG